MVKVGLAEGPVCHVHPVQLGEQPAQLQLIAGSQQRHGVTHAVGKGESELDRSVDGLNGLVPGRQVSPGDHVELRNLWLGHRGHAS